MPCWGNQLERQAINNLISPFCGLSNNCSYTFTIGLLPIGYSLWPRMCVNYAALAAPWNEYVGISFCVWITLKAKISHSFVWIYCSSWYVFKLHWFSSRAFKSIGQVRQYTVFRNSFIHDFFYSLLRVLNYCIPDDLKIITLPTPSYNPHQQIITLPVGNCPEITVSDLVQFN